MVPIPNPGSDEAREMGCRCPVLDNARGRGYMGCEGVFVYSEACPLHFNLGQEEPSALSDTRHD